MGILHPLWYICKAAAATAAIYGGKSNEKSITYKSKNWNMCQVIEKNPPFIFVFKESVKTD